MKVYCALVVSCVFLAQSRIAQAQVPSCIDIFKDQLSFSQRKEVQNHIRLGHLEEVMAFFEKYPLEINYQFEGSQYTYLMWALDLGQRDIADWLLLHGSIDLNRKDFLGRSALLHALLYQDYLSALKILRKPLSRDSFVDDAKLTAAYYLSALPKEATPSSLRRQLRNILDDYDLFTD